MFVSSERLPVELAFKEELIWDTYWACLEETAGVDISDHGRKPPETGGDNHVERSELH